MAQNRVYYACQSVQINGPSGTTLSATNSAWDTVQGLQSVGISTNYNLEPIYQMGQLDLYDNFEEIPEVEVSLNKVLDGKPTLYSMCMGTGELSTLANHRCAVRLTIHPDTDTLASGQALAACEISPAYVSNVSYAFPVEGNFTEDITIVANSKSWLANLSNLTANDSASMAPADDNPNDGAGIARRSLWNDVETVLPVGDGGGIPAGSKVQNVTVSVELGREAIYNLGDRVPFTRYINFPVEITTEIEVIATSGDLVGASEAGDVCANPKALQDKTIKIVLCDGTTLDLGDKNKLTNVNYTGGDTGGGNATISYSYTTYNKFNYLGPNDAASWSTIPKVADAEYDTTVEDDSFPIEP